MAAGAMPPGAAKGRAMISGGVTTAPAVVASDKTPFAAAVRVSGLPPGASYSVKVKLASAARSQFGGTWNPTTRRWCAASSPWSTQPTVCAGPDGILSCWLSARAGAKSSVADEGTASVSIVLRAEGSDSNIEPPDCAKTTVAGPGTGGSSGWVHGPLPAVDETSGVLPVLGKDPAGRIVGSALAEPNLVDDDDNGTVDDESSPTANGPRTFRMTVLSNVLLSFIARQGTAWRNQVVFGGEDLCVPRTGSASALQISVPCTRVGWSGRVVLTAKLLPSAPETIAVQQSPDGVVWGTVREARAGATGTIAVGTTVLGSSRFRAVWLGTRQCPAAVSGSVRVGVLPAMTGYLTRSTVRLGGGIVATGRFRPATPARRVTIIIKRRRDRRPVKSLRVPVVAGRYRCRMVWRRAGSFIVVVVFPGDSRLLRRSVYVGTFSASSG